MSLSNHGHNYDVMERELSLNDSLLDSLEGFGEYLESLLSREAYDCSAHKFQKLLGLMAMTASVVIPLGLSRAHLLQGWFNSLRLHLKRDRKVTLLMPWPCMRARLPCRDRSFRVGGSTPNEPPTQEHLQNQSVPGSAEGASISAG
ncbi:uncharacterized protein AKAME5_001767200, partial [Lates japonicus]